ncbi:hypothetical protein ACFUTX_10650 [Microbacterium sp. NPDC057407]|uniref:hypothetical protein n=1 Tax=Microbacterium sp. NPDC057407 TaxID=3346120 RepID=UPI00366EA51B
MTAADGAAEESSTRPGASWRFFVGLALWIAAVPLAAFFLHTSLVATSVVFPLGLFSSVPEPNLAETLSGRFSWIAGLAVAVAVVAAIAQRWVLLCLAVLLAAGAVLGATVLSAV